MYDTFKLKGLCYFRLKNLVESVKNFNFANLVKEECDRQIQKIDSIEEIEGERQRRLKELEFTYINLFIEETRIVFNDPEFKSQVLKASKSLPRLNFIVRDLGAYNLRFHTPRQEFSTQKDSQIKIKNDQSFKEEV